MDILKDNDIKTLILSEYFLSNFLSRQLSTQPELWTTVT